MSSTAAAKPVIPYDFQAGSESIEWIGRPPLHLRTHVMPAHAHHPASKAQARHGAEEIAARRGGSSDAARTLVMCPARGRKSGHAQKDARQGQRARCIQQPAANPVMPYDRQAGSESIGADWSPLPCACERTTCLPVPIIQLRKRKRGMALPYAAQQRGNRRLPLNPHHCPYTGNYPIGDQSLPDLQPRPPDMPAHARHLALQAQARHGAAEIAAPQGRKLRRRLDARSGEAGTAGGRCPMPRGREEAGGRPVQSCRPARRAVPPRGKGL